MENKVIEMGMKDDAFELKVDPNKDGQPVVELKVFSKEALEEAFKRQEAIAGAKLVSFGFEGAKLKLVLDTDKDGQPLLELIVDTMEIFDEFSKKE